MSRLSIALVVALSLAASSVSSAQDEDAPPTSGEQLPYLLGLHKGSPAVSAMMEWGRKENSVESEGDFSGRGLSLKFEGPRVSEVSLFLWGLNDQRNWRWGLPFGLTIETQSQSLSSSTSWREEEDNKLFTATLFRPYADRKIDGFKAEVQFYRGLRDPQRLGRIAISASPRDIWRQLTTAVQQIMPASQFTTTTWGAYLGADVATDDGSTLAAWAAVPLDGATGSRAGLTLHLTHNRWIDRIEFTSQFQGERPFGIARDASSEDLATKFGEPTAFDKERSHWNFTYADRWPVRLELIRSEGGSAPTIALCCERALVVAWETEMAATGAPSAALVSAIQDALTAAVEHPETLRGREEVEQGLFGTIRWSHTSESLLGVIDGKLTESAPGSLFPARRVEYIVRRYAASEPAFAEEQLDAFRAPLTTALGEGWTCKRHEAEGNNTARLTWSRESDNMFEPVVSVSVEVRSNASGTTLVVEFQIPLD